VAEEIADLAPELAKANKLIRLSLIVVLVAALPRDRLPA